MTTAASKVMACERYIGERKKTNVSALYFCVGFIVILFAFMGYSFSKSNISRIINGYDNCGNICGMRNDWNTINNCGSNDKTLDKFDLSGLGVSTSKCVSNCSDYPGYTNLANRCVPLKGDDDISYIEDLAAHLKEMWKIILIGFAVALVFSYITLVLFRYVIEYIVWGLIIGLVALFSIVAIFFVALSLDKNATSEDGSNGSKGGFYYFAAFFGILALVTGLLAYFFRKRIALVVQLFKEAAKALNDIPLIIAEPLLTFVTMFLALFIFLYFVIVIASSAELKVHNDKKGNFVRADYELGAGAITAHIVNVIAFCWFTQLVVGCQQFVIASTISDWYFARNKDKLSSPIARGFNNLLNFHLGSICLGSIVFTAIFIVRVIIAGVKRVLRQHSAGLVRLADCCFGCFLKVLEQFMQYLVRNAYIVVAKDGTPLYTSGKRAFHLLKENLIDVIALNKVGDIILALGKIFVVAITGFVTYEMMDKRGDIEMAWFPITLVCVFAYLIIHCFMTVFEMTLDTIFLCFCEDCEQNNGMDRPYFMSQDLMAVMHKLNSNEEGATFDRRSSQSDVRALVPPTSVVPLEV